MLSSVNGCPNLENEGWVLGLVKAHFSVHTEQQIIYAAENPWPVWRYPGHSQLGFDERFALLV